MSSHGPPYLRYKSRLPFWDSAAIESGGTEGGFDSVPGIWSDLPLSGQPLPERISPWDVIILDGTPAPGICRLDGGRHLGIDIQRIIGQLVPESSVLNFDPVPFEIVLTLWTPDQWYEAQTLVERILPKPGPNPILRAVQAYHPALALYGISTVYFQAGAFPRHMGKGIIELSLQAYEWNPGILADIEKFNAPRPQASTPGLPTPTPAPLPPSAAGIGP